MKYIIFDMDGLMFDTENMWLESFIEAGNIFNYKLNAQLHDKIIGTNKESQTRILKEELGIDFPYEKFNSVYKQIMNRKLEKGAKPKKGLKELLDYLVNNDYIFAIASSSSRDTIINNLHFNSIDPDIFTTIVDGTMIDKGKPSPDIFLKTCKLLNIEPNEALVLEDSNNGIKAAYDAGCIPILIPDINIIKNETKEMSKYILNDLSEVITLLSK